MAKVSLPNPLTPDNACSVEACRRLAYCRALCSKHYDRMRRTGSTAPRWYDEEDGVSYATYFWSRVVVTADSNRCWLWKDSVRWGYGVVRFQQRSAVATHVAWFLTHGVMPTSFLLHSCDTRACVNPTHLREGTAAENSRDMIIRHRAPSAILTDEMAAHAKWLLAQGKSEREVARKIGLTRSGVRSIKRGAWKHIEPAPYNPKEDE